VIKEQQFLAVGNCFMIEAVAKACKPTQSYGISGDCFASITGNRFKISRGLIIGMTLHVANPVDKLKWLKKMGTSADEAIVVGDGYTDIPLLDWAKISILSKFLFKTNF
jgi:soluble P-type ATPase